MIKLQKGDTVIVAPSCTKYHHQQVGIGVIMDTMGSRCLVRWEDESTNSYSDTPGEHLQKVACSLSPAHLKKVGELRMTIRNKVINEIPPELIIYLAQLLSLPVDPVLVSKLTKLKKEPKIKTT